MRLRILRNLGGDWPKWLEQQTVEIDDADPMAVRTGKSLVARGLAEDISPPPPPKPEPAVRLPEEIQAVPEPPPIVAPAKAEIGKPAGKSPKAEK